MIQIILLPILLLRTAFDWAVGNEESYLGTKSKQKIKELTERQNNKNNKKLRINDLCLEPWLVIDSLEKSHNENNRIALEDFINLDVNKSLNKFNNSVFKNTAFFVYTTDHAMTGYIDGEGKKYLFDNGGFKFSTNKFTVKELADAKIQYEPFKTPQGENKWCVPNAISIMEDLIKISDNDLNGVKRKDLLKIAPLVKSLQTEIKNNDVKDNAKSKEIKPVPLQEKPNPSLTPNQIPLEPPNPPLNPPLNTTNTIHNNKVMQP